METDPLEARMLRMLDADLSAEEVTELEQELIASPQARALWQRISHMHSALEIRYAASKTIAESVPVPMDRILEQQRRKVIRISMIGAAAVLAIAALVLWMISAPELEPRIASFRVVSGTTFSLTHADSAQSPMGNSMVSGSSLVIEHGVAEISLPYGVRAVIEGPASLTMQDERTLKFGQGQGYFEITSAKGKGFTVVTPHQRIVDLGTSFAVKVQPGNDAVDLHVLDGHVRIDSADGIQGETINAPRSVQLSAAQVTKDIKPSSFLSVLPEKLETIFEEDFEHGLLPDQQYSVTMDPSVIVNLSGRPSGGISSKQPWDFQTSSGAPDSISVRNAGFEKGGEKLSHGDAIPGWHQAVKHIGWGTDRSRSSLLPTEGEFFGRVFRGRHLQQELAIPIVAGTTYVLTVDCGFGKAAVSNIRLWGSDAGSDVALAEKTLRSEERGWKKNQHLVFTASEEHAVGQTLGIRLTCQSGEFSAFDRVRLGTLGETLSGLLPNHKVRLTDGTAPQILTLFPKANAVACHPVQNIRMTFDQPIRIGTGRVTVTNRSDDSQTTHIAGSDQLIVAENTLSFLPRLGLRDGTASMGHLNSWKTQAWAGVFNPAGNGRWYSGAMFHDQSDVDGAPTPMRGPTIATIQATPSGHGISRKIGTITEDTRYSVTLAIGTRAATAAESAPFAGYRIRLSSGDTVLAEISSDTPPGAPSSVTNVGGSWDSSSLPEGVALGDPLMLKIAPLAGQHGYLDIDAVRVSLVLLSK